MPTPAPAQTAFQPPAQNAPSVQNGSSSDGAILGSDATEHTDMESSTNDSRDAIREGKEKAKAVMAASGVHVASQSGEQSPSSNARQDNLSEDGVQGTNGPFSSRKRSRSGSRLPAQASQPEAKDDQISIENFLLQQYIERDSLHSAAINDQSEAVRNQIIYKNAERQHYTDLRHRRQLEPGSIFGYGYMGYGNGFTDIRGVGLIYPGDVKKKRPGNRRSRFVHVSRKEKERQSEQLEELVPIRLEVEFDKIKLRDTFTWNLHDRITKPHIFAETLVEDFQIPNESIAPVLQQVRHDIEEQIQDYHPHVYIDEEPLDPHLPYHAYKNDEMRILIKLNITIGQHYLEDQFEWELNNPANDPEEFARLTARELSLSGEFATAIAHSIREQCQMYTKSLYIIGHPFDGRPVEDSDVKDALLPSPLSSVFRPAHNAKDFTPLLYELTEADLERTEVSMLREQRRQKRSVTRRGGPALPELKEKPRTVRTLVVSSVLPGAAGSLDESRLYKVSRSSGRGRRAAGRNDGGDDSDESDESDSAPDSPAPSQIVSGTARTRNMRGAASAAQAAMRANLGRSATPEIATLHQHETRTSARRSVIPDREESVAETLIIKLRVPKDKLRMIFSGQRFKPSVPVGSATPLLSHQNLSHSGTPASNSMLPPPSPAMQQNNNKTGVTSPVPQPVGSSTASQQQQWQYAPDGGTDAPHPIPPGFTPPPPPPWLSDALRGLQEKYQEDEFEAIMRHMVIDKETGTVIRADPMPQGPSVKYRYLPRIRCNDCPGKLYTAGPERTVDNFEVHLRNKGHRQKVDDRRKRSGH